MSSKPGSEGYPPEVIAVAERAIQSANAGAMDRCEVATALLYIVGGPVKQLPYLPRNPTVSYEWKHRAEQWGRTVGLSSYVSNDAFIVAADWLRVPSRRRPNFPNVEYALKTTRDQGSALLQAWQRHRVQS